MAAKKPIYIVDDDAGFLEGIERLLIAHGLPVRTFSSAEEFRREVDPNDAACLILDIDLGSISGIEVMHDLILSGLKTPVVLITAKDGEWTRQAAFSAGCSAFIQKPFSAMVLMDAIRNAVAGSGLSSRP